MQAVMLHNKLAKDPRRVWYEAAKRRMLALEMKPLIGSTLQDYHDTHKSNESMLLAAVR